MSAVCPIVHVGGSPLAALTPAELDDIRTHAASAAEYALAAIRERRCGLGLEWDVMDALVAAAATSAAEMAVQVPVTR